jgi:cytoskeletal protein RodZ
MPLDTAAVTTGLDMSLAADRYGRGSDPTPRLEAGPNVGAALRAVREHYRLSLEDVALATYIRRAYLEALEEMRLDQLPSRPFVIGYVRAYAGTLGLDPDRAVARFKMEYPEDGQALRAPVGVSREGDRRLRPMIIGAVLVVSAFITWNIIQHALSKAAPAPAAAGAEVVVSGAKVRAPLTQGPISVGAPLPAPQESTVPAPYVTPGLAPSAADASARPVPAPPAAGSPFQTQGVIYGAPAAQSLITLQAAKSVTLIVRGADGSVYFARQLSSGQAYRAPQTAGLSVEASDPAEVNVFVGGLLKGPMPLAKSVIAKLAQT